MFSQACEKNSVHELCLPHCMLGHTHHPWTHTRTPTDTRLGRHHLPTPRDGHCSGHLGGWGGGMYSCVTNFLILIVQLKNI